jgi:acetyltransferase
VGRLVKDPDGRSGEFAVLVADDFQGVGLGYKLTEMIIRIARDKGLKNIYGFILRDNVRMREVATTLGFTVRGVGADEVRVVLDL